MAATEQDWYTSKEIVQMVQGLKEELITLRTELRTTTEAVRRYNNLREQLDAQERKLAEHLMVKEGQANLAKGIREWGGWAVAVISLLAALSRR